MISPEELQSYIDTLRAAGVTGRVKIGDIEVTIAPAVGDGAAPVDRKSLAREYDRMLFACTEGIQDEGDS